MLSKLQFKEWFDRYKYRELAATTTALIMQSVKSVLTVVRLT
jgi:hypothetical protein